MKKILFTIQWYPSILSANALCDQKIIETLIYEGYEITCLVYRPFGAKAEEVLDNVRVIRFLKSSWWNIKIEAKQNNGKFSKFILSLDRVILRISQIVTIPIYPNTEPFAYRKFARNALKLQEKYHFDIVISEFHGLDSLHAGSAIKKQFPRTKFIGILWDPFTGKEHAKYLPTEYAKKKIEAAEKAELECADKIVVMESSRSYHEKHSVNKSYYDKFVYLDIPGIVKPKGTTEKARFILEDRINIVYAGILSLPDRDPDYIVNLLSQTKSAKQIHLIFLCTGNGKQKLENLKKNFPGIITINGFVNRDELASIYYKADFMLNIGGPNPNMVPSKVFEYLSYGKPILSTYYIDKDASLKYLMKYPLAICMDQRKSIEQNVAKLNNKMDQVIGKHIEFSEVQKLYPGNTPEIYKKLIDSMLKGN